MKGLTWTRSKAIAWRSGEPMPWPWRDSTPGFWFYRIADIEFSFRLRDHGHGRAVAVAGLPVRKHEHRLWETTEPADRDRLSRRNFYRFLDRWGKREDLTRGTMTPMSDEYSAKISELQARRKKNLAMGGEVKIAKQHERGKLTVRERLNLLFDQDTFVEFGLLAQQQAVRGGEPDPDGTPADGVVTGHGQVEGRQVWVIAYDFTVMAGSMGAVGEQFKAARVRETRPSLSQAHRVAARLGRGAHPGGKRVHFCGHGLPVRGPGRDVGRDPAGRRDAGPLLRRHRLHPRSRRLRADGQGHVVDVARWRPPRQRRPRARM